MKFKWSVLIIGVLGALLAASTIFLASKTQRAGELEAKLVELETENAKFRKESQFRGEKQKAMSVVPPSPKAPRESNGRSLYDAAGRGDVELLKKILAEHPEFLNATPGNLRATALHNAAHSGQVATVAELLVQGANVNAQNDSGFTPLHDAVTIGSASVVELLLNNNADCAILNKAGQTPLRYALSKKHDALVDILRNHGAKE